MKSTLMHLCGAFLALVGLVACQSGPRPVDENAALSPVSGQASMVETINSYLVQDCGTGEPNPSKLLQEVVAFKAEAIPTLLVAVKSGPSQKARAELIRDAEGDFEENQTFLKKGGLAALEDSEVAREAEALTREDYLGMRLRAYRRGFQERSLYAIVAIGDRSAVAGLREAEGNPEIDPGFRAAIAEAIGKLQR